MIVLDASVIIAYGRAADPHHEASAAILENPRLQFALHALTMAECLVGPTRSGQTADMVALFDAVAAMRVDFDARAPERLALLRVTTGLQLPDCCVLDAAIEHGAELATFDARLAHVASERGVGLANTVTS